MQDVKMGGSTPSGRSKSYSYYNTLDTRKGNHHRVPVESVDEQVPGLLDGIAVRPSAVPALRKLYQALLTVLRGPSVKEQLEELHQRKKRVEEEEAALARLYARKQLTDGAYACLYREWQDKVAIIAQEIASLEHGTDDIVDDLDLALVLLTCLPRLYHRLDTGDRRRLLHILFKRIIIDTQGQLVEVQLHPPFTDLTQLTRRCEQVTTENGLNQVSPPSPCSEPPSSNHEDGGFL